MILTNNQPTGFYCYDVPVIVIYTMDGKPFYVMSNVNGRKVHFNLPLGMFETSNVLYEAPLRKYKCEEPPKAERKIKLPKHIKYEFGNNKNKASVFLDLGAVLIDNSFKDKPLYMQRQIKLHELAHYFYSTEWKCDRWAQYQMLKLGYNPSQIGATNGFCLTHTGSQHRIDLAKAYAKNVK